MKSNSTLVDFCEAIVDCEHKTAQEVEYGIPSIRTTDIKNGRIDFTNAKKVSEETYRQWTARLEPRLGDLILAREAPVGEVGIIPKGQRACLGQRTVLIRTDEMRLHSRFLQYLLITPAMRHEIQSRSEGSVVPHLNMSAIRMFKLPPLPPIAEQKRIAHILGTLDDKIELNRRMNETLEAMARALFKSWFVDFDPVRAKAAGRKPEGIDADTAALFPSEFEDSELGKIPKGWRVGTFNNIIERLSVGEKYDQWSASPYGKIPILDQGKTGIIGYHDNQPGINASTEKPVVVFANHTCYMRLITFPFSAIQNVLPFIGNGVDTIWVYYATFGKQQFIEYKGHWPDFVINEVVIPNMPLTELFTKQVKPLVLRAKKNESENVTLITIRDILLPKLLSGKLTAKESVS